MVDRMAVFAQRYQVLGRVVRRYFVQVMDHQFLICHTHSADAAVAFLD
jgi:hypothetical protein